jgi:hypothetical protein
VFRDPVRLRDPPDTADIPQRVERWREMAANTTDEDYQKAYTALADAYERLIILIGDVESWLSVSERSPARQERETLARLGRSAYLGRPNRGDLPRSVETGLMLGLRQHGSNSTNSPVATAIASHSSAVCVRIRFASGSLR